jgi:hypothetical protein
VAAVHRRDDFDPARDGHLRPGVAGLWLFVNAGFFVYATCAGKFAVWADQA